MKTVQTTTDADGARSTACGGYTPTNREKSKAAARTRVWCKGCDRQLVSLTEKCPVCGKRVNRRKIKGYNDKLSD